MIVDRLKTLNISDMRISLRDSHIAFSAFLLYKKLANNATFGERLEICNLKVARLILNMYFCNKETDCI